MKVIVDSDLCEANQMCMRIAPAVFRVDEADRLHILVESVEPELVDRVESAVRACPRQALRLLRDPGTTAPSGT
jgi:ferredoxin